MKAEIEKHCQALRLCQQRPGRLLSVVDLIERETLSLKTAAFLLEVISGGSSFIVGARPGGAGKTTVMVSLLNFIPPGMEIIPTDEPRKLDANFYSKPTCFLCHEIGPGPYYAYLWGDSLLSFFRLKKQGHLLSSNVHADTLEEARKQICELNQVPISLFHQIELYLFLRVEESGKRILETAWYSLVPGKHRLVIAKGDLVRDWPEKEKRLRAHQDFLKLLLASGIRQLEAVRAAVVDYLKT
ncbi:MAG: hypothetical protein NC911_10075 [Candidatus Omnitrophica bacterium]|nr:hypothetical protein [Candidatus Omnitrophota bacterium]